MNCGVIQGLYMFRWYLTRLLAAADPDEDPVAIAGGTFWVNKASTGIVSDNMAVDNGAFAKVEVNAVYQMNVKAWRKSSDPSNFGKK